MLFEQFSHAKEDFAAFGGWHQSPFFKGGMGSGSGGLGIGLTRKREVSQDFSRSWIVVREGFAAFAPCYLPPM